LLPFFYNPIPARGRCKVTQQPDEVAYIPKTLVWVQGPATAGGGVTARKGAGGIRKVSLPFVRPCTCTLRLITTGLPGRPSQEQKGLDERALTASQWPSPPCGRPRGRPCERTSPAQAPSPRCCPPPACSHPRWLWPRRHAEEQHLTQAPHPIRQASRHRRCTRPPQLR
jgi:hypothetical protein